ncbi:MAG: hypothetical protein ACUVTX_03470, partial [Bacteroidales bacterium]
MNLVTSFNMKRSKLIVVSFLMSLGMNIFAQNITNDTLETITLNEVTVSALRTQLNTKDATQSVSVISKNDILVSPYNNVEDII